VVFEQSAHLALIEEPHQYLAVLEDFIDTAETSRPASRHGVTGARSRMPSYHRDLGPGSSCPCTARADIGRWNRHAASSLHIVHSRAAQTSTPAECLSRQIEPSEQGLPAKSLIT